MSSRMDPMIVLVEAVLVLDKITLLSGHPDHFPRKVIAYLVTNVFIVLSANVGMCARTKI